MFDRLSSRLIRCAQFARVRTHREKHLEALREVRLALLEADVHYATARVHRARQGEEFGRGGFGGVAGQQLIKAFYDELVALMGGQQKDFNLTAIPAEVMLLGLHGSGKTTTAGKLARLWKEKGKKVLLVAGDIRRPAAAEQLEVLAKQSGAGIINPAPGSLPLGRRALLRAGKLL